uniref:Ig-like domain-containing protein n=1 Tax=Erpetoichthys calabaricus TaxID=27687 RepID=A0A8C4SAQ2_ERPCA
MYTYVVIRSLTLQDSVTQFPSFVSKSEGAESTLNCTYEYTSSTAAAQLSLQWYKQTRNGVPQYMIQHNKQGDASDKFQLAINISSKSGSLTITPSLSDSAIYYCAIEPHSATKTTSLIINMKLTIFSHFLFVLCICNLYFRL